jgi:hypothetical protein
VVGLEEDPGRLTAVVPEPEEGDTLALMARAAVGSARVPGGQGPASETED